MVSLKNLIMDPVENFNGKNLLECVIYCFNLRTHNFVSYVYEYNTPAQNILCYKLLLCECI